MPTTRVERREAAALAYENAGREITQAFDILNTNLTLAAGTLGALLAVLGAGDLFRSETVSVVVAGHAVRTPSTTQAHLIGIPRFSSTALLLLAAAFPLILRFFIRATIGYQQLERFNLVQRKTWSYLSGAGSWDLARTTVEVYVQEWRSPKPVGKLVQGSFKYGFAWVFALSAVVLLWAFISASGFFPRLVAVVFVGGGSWWELRTLNRYDFIKGPTAEEQHQLDVAAEAGADEPSEADSVNTPRPEPDKEGEGA